MKRTIRLFFITVLIIIETAVINCTPTSTDKNGTISTGCEIGLDNNSPPNAVKPPEGTNEEEIRAIKEFQSKNTIDKRPALNKIIHLLEKGKTKNSILGILGEPNKKFQNGKIWFYDTFYSAFLQIQFDETGKLTSIEMK